MAGPTIDGLPSSGLATVDGKPVGGGTIPADAGIVKVASAANLPAAILAPDGVMRVPLAEDTVYLVTATFVWPRLMLPRVTDPTTFLFTEIKTSRLGVAILIDGDDTPHVWGRGIGGLSLDRNQWVDIGNSFAGRSTVLFDLTGGTFVSLWSIVFLQLVNFKSLGNLVDLPLQIAQTNWVNCESGLVARISPTFFGSHFAQGMRVQQNPGAAAMVKPMLCLQGSPLTTSISAGNVFLNPGDAFLCISSGATGAYDLLGSSYEGTDGGDFFRADVAEALTAFANVDIEITAFADSSVDPGVDTTAVITGYSALTIGQVILIDSTSGDFDGTHTITRVADDELSFDFATVFTSTTTGAVKLTRVTATGDHVIVNNEQIAISGTTSYNGSFATVFATNTTFDIPVAFVADDATGSVVTVSLNTRSVGVNAQDNGALRNSRRMGFGRMNASSTVTTIAMASTYQAVDLGTLIDADDTERFTLIDAAAGIYRYDDTRPLEPGINAQITAIKSGSLGEYRFAVSINGAIPVFATAFYAPMEVKTTKVSTSPIGVNSINQNDTIQIMVAADGHTDSLTITDIALIIKGT